MNPQVSLSESPSTIRGPNLKADTVPPDTHTASLPTPHPEPDSPVPSWRSAAVFRAVWRWHFYASVFCLPFVMILATSGGIYLFKPQIEAIAEQPFEQLPLNGDRRPASELVNAALAANPGREFQGYELPQSDRSAARVILGERRDSLRVYVHPSTAEPLHQVAERDRFMRVIHRLHGELWLGERGSWLVELAASWTVVMLLSGLWLWWPRQSRSWAGVLYPRLGGNDRVFWRDIHSVTGFWISATALLLILSGLPWSNSWGNYLKLVRSWTGTASARQDWSMGGERGSKNVRTKSAQARSDEHAEHHGHAANDAPVAQPRARLLEIKQQAQLDRVVAIASAENLAHPVVIAAPTKPDGPWTAKSMTANRPWRVKLDIDGDSGQITRREGFWERHWIDRVIALGIALHEGQLFGWPNQILGLLTVLGLLLICLSAVVMWYRRRPTGELGAPPLAADTPALLSAWPVLLPVLMLAVWLPMFAGSLLVVLLVERLVLRRLPGVNHWLGLVRPGERPVAASCSPESLAMLLAGLLIGNLTGCGPTPVTGGTPGYLDCQSGPLAEVEVRLHRAKDSSRELIGFGVTGSDGTFELVTPGARGALQLPPGEYVCTFESVGAPITFPEEYQQADRSPLLLSWSPADTILSLELPLRTGNP